MGLIYKKKITEDCVIGFWEITENLDEVMSRIKLSDEETEAMKNFSNERRRLQWLCTRALLAEISDSEKKIIYNNNGKPYLLDASNNISISHSDDLVSIILSKNHLVGLDIEKITGKVEKIEARFLSSEERLAVDEKNRINQLYTYWCAKEALYKIFGEKEIAFEGNIKIDPFVYDESGSFTGRVLTSRRSEEYELSYCIIYDYMVVWIIK
ncbi:MAG: hypothetical protein A2W91_15065 [Bacteroidetes bacterium GWF2_38_335]|nr:MAG: hypothetical protein A2W91_15065 [Bacteroidetes bacterium GWF2_38_335]OFY78707.1 MAG: hypothetical protein A2281_14185 [Bacteroidetes bacterium RIFOXYA12_FULL_38_20]HBS88467.1 hypothetical protein [Bacteroidales bacterium]